MITIQEFLLKSKTDASTQLHYDNTYDDKFLEIIEDMIDVRYHINDLTYEAHNMKYVLSKMLGTTVKPRYTDVAYTSQVEDVPAEVSFSCYTNTRSKTPYEINLILGRTIEESYVTAHTDAGDYIIYDDKTDDYIIQDYKTVEFGNILKQKKRGTIFDLTCPHIMLYRYEGRLKEMIDGLYDVHRR